MPFFGQETADVKAKTEAQRYSLKFTTGSDQQLEDITRLKISDGWLFFFREVTGEEDFLVFGVPLDALTSFRQL